MEGKEAEVDDDLLALMREYNFRKTFGGSHEEYLDEPLLISQWFNAITGIIGELQARP